MKVKHVSNIGVGGFGVVEKVVDAKGTYYAKKTFQMPLSTNSALLQNARERFKREIFFQSKMDHKNIVPIIHYDTTADPPFYIMPMANGSLQDDIDRSSNLNGNFMQALLDIMAGLEEIHSKGIHHRDLKPQNVLRFGNGKDSYYAISDFGLIAVDQTRVSTLTTTGMGMGSDYYTAPEVVSDLKHVSVMSDVYSLGCILHNFVGVKKRIPCNEIQESGIYGAILIGCTRKDPNRRFKSVATVRDLLLSLDPSKLQPHSDEGKRLAGILTRTDPPITVDEWAEIVNYIDDNLDNNEGKAVLAKLSLENIKDVLKTAYYIAQRLGKGYAAWIRDGSFIFAECDGLATRLEEFIMNSEIDVKVECIMAMLYMGTEHNRWYVENKFVRIVDHKLDGNVADRLAIEFEIDGYKMVNAVNHLTRSINYNVHDLHPQLLKVYKKFIK